MRISSRVEANSLLRFMQRRTPSLENSFYRGGGYELAGLLEANDLPQLARECGIEPDLEMVYKCVDVCLGLYVDIHLHLQYICIYI